ncbi:LEA type 2 family protein [Flavobacteriaceae bacterium S356]|uniref:LEA type 2 family protein n=1 Tax=Asprobacillus argus TaxID=3076534 RepID=A0ABU3LHS2_9FLAO|nr:LEA type 2 family protein [Flavobacteriaceae bacterium S356]
MKKAFILITSLLVLASCAVTKKPVFVKVDNVKIIDLSKKTITLGADAFFKNPNDIGGKFYTDSIQVWVNGAKLAKVSSEPFKIPARKEFAIPMIVEIPIKRVFENNKNGILGGLVDSFLNKSIKVRYVGNLYFRTLGISKTFPVNTVQEIKIK